MQDRTSLLYDGKPTQFWDDTTANFGIKKVFLWVSVDAHGVLATPHDHMQPALMLASIFLPISRIMTNSRSQMHLHVILSRLRHYAPDKVVPLEIINDLPIGFPINNIISLWYQRATSDACFWSHGQTNLQEESCLDCEIHFTAIMERCAHIADLH